MAKLNHWRILDSQEGKKILQELESHFFQKYEEGNPMIAHESAAKRKVIQYIETQISNSKKESKNE